MASDRDRHAARLSSNGVSYTDVAQQLGFPDRRAAHRGVQRALAEPITGEAALRGQRIRAADEQLLGVSRQLEVLMELHQPADLLADHRTWNRIRVALWRVTVQRCRLQGLFVHPWRHDLLVRQDVPLEVWLHLKRQANWLEREARIPVRYRTLKRAPSASLAPVVPLRIVDTPLVDVNSFVPVSVRRLLDQLAA